MSRNGGLVANTAARNIANRRGLCLGFSGVACLFSDLPDTASYTYLGTFVDNAKLNIKATTTDGVLMTATSKATSGLISVTLGSGSFGYPTWWPIKLSQYNKRLAIYL